MTTTTTAGVPVDLSSLDSFSQQIAIGISLCLWTNTAQLLQRRPSQFQARRNRFMTWISRAPAGKRLRLLRRQPVITSHEPRSSSGLNGFSVGWTRLGWTLIRIDGPELSHVERSRQSSRREELRTTTHAFGQLRLHGLIRNPKIRCDFLMRHAVRHPQRYDLPTTIRQTANRIGQQGKFLLFVEGVGRIRPLLHHAKCTQISHTLDRNHSPSAQKSRAALRAVVMRNALI